MKRSNSVLLPPYFTPATTGPDSSGSQDATVVSTSRRAAAGTEARSKQSSTIGWRVGIQLNRPRGIRQSSPWMFSAKVKKTSCSRIMSTRARASGSIVPAR